MTSRRDAAPWRDAATLREYYGRRGLTVYEVADLLGTTDGTVSKWLNRLGVETRDRDEYLATGREHPAWVERARFRVDDDDYGRWDSEADDETVLVHRLAAVAWFGFDAVRDREVHHKQATPKGVPEVNAEWNLSLMSAGDHMRHHRLNEPDRDRDERGRFA